MLPNVASFKSGRVLTEASELPHENCGIQSSYQALTGGCRATSSTAHVLRVQGCLCPSQRPASCPGPCSAFLLPMPNSGNAFHCPELDILSTCITVCCRALQHGGHVCAASAGWSATSSTTRHGPQK